MAWLRNIENILLLPLLLLLLLLLLLSLLLLLLLLLLAHFCSRNNSTHPLLLLLLPQAMHGVPLTVCPCSNHRLQVRTSDLIEQASQPLCCARIYP